MKFCQHSVDNLQGNIGPGPYFHTALQLLAIVETWMVQIDPNAFKLNCLSSRYRVVQSPRQTAAVVNHGGRLFVIYYELLSVKLV